VTSIAVAGARVLAVGLDGLKVRSRDGGNSFQEAPSADGLSLTAALFNADGTPLLFSRRGVMPRQE
ncbi:glycosyl hydrolase, partial [Pseudomonas aeruginosa]|nr:glycosyl hydrolase [Pseudomonas aeruginosa]